MRRRFLRGPLAELDVVADLAPENGGTRLRLGARSRALVEAGQDAELVGRLVETIERGDELELAQLRPCWICAGTCSAPSAAARSRARRGSRM